MAEPNAGSILKGVFPSCVLNFLIFTCGAFLALAAGLPAQPSILRQLVQWTGGAFSVGIGVTQLFWLIPLYRREVKDGKTETANGIIVAGGITALLSAACWGLILHL